MSVRTDGRLSKCVQEFLQDNGGSGQASSDIFVPDAKIRT
jgi:hypothetical protein